MSTIFFAIIVLILKAYLKESKKIKGTPQTNLYFQNDKPKFKNAIIEQIKQPARVSYIMNHGTSINNTHEYCYMLYLKIDFAGYKLPEAPLFNKHTMTFYQTEKVSAKLLVAANAYLRDRRDYLGHLN